MTFKDTSDEVLAAAAGNGSAAAVTELVRRHRPFLFQVALRLTGNSFDAEDLTQEALIRALTSLGTFEGRSKFQTWLYRLAFNHYLNAKRSKLEHLVQIDDWEGYFEVLDLQADAPMTEFEQEQHKEEIFLTMVSCTAGMLLCLSRDQRLAFVLATVFELDSSTCAEVMGISAEAFRQRLHRARLDLQQWMSQKCGWVNPLNPCRCHKKTKAFREQGWLDKSGRKLRKDVIDQVMNLSRERHDQDLLVVERISETLFRSHPRESEELGKDIIESLLNDPLVKATFAL